MLGSLYRLNMEQKFSGIITKCVNGSQRAQRQLFNLTYSDGMNIALRYSSNAEDAKEILSDAFIRVFNKLHQFDIDRAFLPWFNRIIIHASSDFYRYRKDPVVPLSKVAEPSFDSHIIDYLSYQDLLSLVQKLPPSYRAVFNLSTIEGYKHREIAELLNISEGTSKSHLSRARIRLQAMIIDISKRKGIASIQQEDQSKINQCT